MMRGVDEDWSFLLWSSYCFDGFPGDAVVGVVKYCSEIRPTPSTIDQSS